MFKATLIDQVLDHGPRFDPKIIAVPEVEGGGSVAKLPGQADLLKIGLPYPPGFLEGINPHHPPALPRHNESGSNKGFEAPGALLHISLQKPSFSCTACRKRAPNRDARAVLAMISCLAASGRFAAISTGASLAHH
jgi:hypothetical protein